MPPSFGSDIPLLQLALELGRLNGWGGWVDLLVTGHDKQSLVSNTGIVENLEDIG